MNLLGTITTVHLPPGSAAGCTPERPPKVGACHLEHEPVVHLFAPNSTFWHNSLDSRTAYQTS